MTFRFIHTGDWQLGKPFGGIPGDAGAELRSQRMRTVRHIAEHAHARGADAVLVAGDAFDANEASDRTLVQAVDAMKPFSGAWILLPGNHDAALPHSVWTRLRAMEVPANIVVADRPEPIMRGAGSAAILPAPLRRRRESDDQTAWFDNAATPPGVIRIGLAHGSIANRLPRPAESGCEIAEDRATTARLAYLALGDWHGALKIAPRTYYSGTPEPDRHRENDPGFVNLVEIDGPDAPERVEKIEVGHYRWLKRDIELLNGGIDAALGLLSGLGDEANRQVVALTLSGALSLAERRRLDGELDRWRSRFHHLDVDVSALIDEPTADDLDAVDKSGFVRLALDRLREQADDAGYPDRDAARVALRMLYLDHMAQDR